MATGGLHCSAGVDIILFLILDTPDVGTWADALPDRMQKYY